MHISYAAAKFDPAKAKADVRKHGVNFVDAEQALRNPCAATLEDDDADGEPRFVTLGMDSLGRVLVVVWIPRGDKARIISAR